MKKITTNQEFKIQLTTLSPLAINNGEQLSPLSDYFIVAGRLHYVDANEFQQLLSTDDELMGKYEAKIKTTEIEGAQNFLNKMLSNEALKGIANGTSVAFSGTKTFLLNTIIRSNGQPYIPGSSIKGAIKNAFLYYWLRELEGQKRLNSFLLKHYESFREDARYISDLSKQLKKEKKRQQKKEIKRKIDRSQKRRNDDIAKFERDIQKEAFGISDQQQPGMLRQPASNLSLSDSETLTSDSIQVACIMRRSLSQKVNDWELASQEYIRPGIICTSSIRINTTDNDWKEYNKETPFASMLLSTSQNLSQVFNVLNYFHKDVAVQSQIFNLKKIQVQPGTNEGILHLGTGKGIYRNTVLLAIHKYYEGKGWNFISDFLPLLNSNAGNHDQFPRSVSHIHGQPLGWVKITDLRLERYKEQIEKSY